MKTILFLAALCLSFIAEGSDAFLARDVAITTDSGIVRYRTGTSVQKQSDGKYLMPDRRVVDLPADVLTPHQLAVPPVAVSIVPATPAAKTPATPAPAKGAPVKATPVTYHNPLGTPRLEMNRKR